jgi:hypothetical protein
MHPYYMPFPEHYSIHFVDSAEVPDDDRAPQDAVMFLSYDENDLEKE